ncbi:MAG: adenine methyltransferase [Ktedonobacterales bacterium]|nr:adenine methyltransferase [Ktedonobacterales bacterium]
MEGQQYRVILANPPWSYRVWSTPKPLMKRDGSRLDGKRVAAAHYSTMSLEQITRLPVSTFAARDSALFLWVTMPCLPDGLAVLDAWGFTYKTVAFTWVKTNRTTGNYYTGLGHYTRGNAEVCLLGTRGNGVKRQARDVPQIIETPKRQHSRKPDEQYGRIMRLFDGPYLELFARQQWPGWDTAFSNQEGEFPAQPFLFGETAS